MKLIKAHNSALLKYVEPGSVQMIYADMMYDDLNFSWILQCEQALADNGSLFIQTDYRSVAQAKLYADQVFKPFGYLNNWIIWPYDWGGRPQDAFGRKHDDILWFVKNDKFKFYPERVQIPKAVVSVGLNPSGRTTKTPTDVWSDIGNFMTTSAERIHGENGVAIAWQKPERLLERIILCSTDVDDLVVDPFLGTGTTGAVCKKLSRQFVGFDTNPKMIEIAKNRIRNPHEKWYPEKVKRNINAD